MDHANYRLVSHWRVPGSGSILLRAVFAANHRWAMRQGKLSLCLELRRRRARTSAERESIGPPPGPTFRPSTELRKPGIPPERRRRSPGRKVWIGFVVSIVALLYAAWPRRVDLRRFEAISMARRETALWRNYYEHRYFRLAGGLYALNRTEYGFSPADSARLAAYAATAASVFQPTQSRSEAQAAIPWLVRHFDLLASRANLEADPRDLARSELDWWQLRREHAAPETYGEVIARVQSGIYGVPESTLIEAARERARAMDLRDRLSSTGLESADWYRIEGMLHRAYAGLKAAVYPAP